MLFFFSLQKMLTDYPKYYISYAYSMFLLGSNLYFPAINITYIKNVLKMPWQNGKHDSIFSLNSDSVCGLLVWKLNLEPKLITPIFFLQ